MTRDDRIAGLMMVNFGWLIILAMEIYGVREYWFFVFLTVLAFLKIAVGCVAVMWKAKAT